MENQVRYIETYKTQHSKKNEYYMLRLHGKKLHFLKGVKQDNGARGLNSK